MYFQPLASAQVARVPMPLPHSFHYILENSYYASVRDFMLTVLELVDDILSESFNEKVQDLGSEGSCLLLEL